jgi:hypothetical protein
MASATACWGNPLALRARASSKESAIGSHISANPGVFAISWAIRFTWMPINNPS